MINERCESKSPNGTQCGLPKGHLGKHQNGYICPTWSDFENKKEKEKEKE